MKSSNRSDNRQLPKIKLLHADAWKTYELLDSGDGKTFERFGPYTLVRSEPQAIWSPGLPKQVWENADVVRVPTGGEHGGYWRYNTQINQPWEIDYFDQKCEIRLSKSRHIGVFPEQASQWDWIREQVQSADQPLKVLNLFGYTGMATAAAVLAGAHVTHVDASKHAVSWASHNLTLSGLGSAPVRWLVEDARKYLKREAKRQSFYDGIILDPPKFGRGPSGKVWSYLQDITELLALCRKVLTSNPKFICLTSYAIQASALIPHQAMQEMVSGIGGKVNSGELITVDSSQGHILSHSLFTHWSTS